MFVVFVHFIHALFIYTYNMMDGCGKLLRLM